MNKVLVIPLSDPVSVEYLYFSSIAGLTFIERLCWTSQKAGYKNSLILYRKPSDGLKKTLNHVPGQFYQSLQSASFDTDTTFVFLRRDILPTKNFLKKIPVPDKKDTLYLMGENPPAMAINVSDISKLSEILNIPSNILSLQEILSKSYPSEIINPDSKSCYSIKDHDDISEVEKKLYHGLIKETDSFLSRHINRKISLLLTRLLINTSISPNQMSLISTGIGVIGAYFLSFPKTSLQIFGALLFLLHSIIDGCDGEIARLKYMESRWGGILDFWGDNVVHAAVFLGIGLAWKDATGSMIPLWCSGLAIGGAFFSAGVVYRTTMRSKKDDEPLYTSISHQDKKSRLIRIADYLSRRDFIYLVVLLAIFGKLHWFLILAAVGAPVFFLFILWINYK